MAAGFDVMNSTALYRLDRTRARLRHQGANGHVVVFEKLFTTIRRSRLASMRANDGAIDRLS
jgi:hypothetical protein